MYHAALIEKQGSKTDNKLALYRKLSHIARGVYVTSCQQCIFRRRSPLNRLMLSLNGEKVE